MSILPNGLLHYAPPSGLGSKNKPAAQTLPDATPPVGKIHALSKIAVTFEPIQLC